MATSQPKPLSPTAVQADEDGFIALKEMAADYKPANQTYTVQAVQALVDALSAAHEAEKLAGDALKAKRDAAVAAELAFHQAMLGVKEQVIAQYGKNSDQVASLGLKKKSEYRRPVRKTKATEVRNAA
ncbi:MAG: hypothetical protein HYR77_00205 [Ignavibacteria bacterium]|nr:hypothetical protein [Ignavibacteria bacterium]